MASRRRAFTAAEARAYERSNAIARIRLPESAVIRAAAGAVGHTLALGDRRQVQLASQRLLDICCGVLRVPPLAVEICGTRPLNHYGELHGLYTPAATRRMRDSVQVWMYTARRRQVVAFKTFLRTLLHELCHHLDYELLKLDRSFHTEGFYKRESSLMYAIAPAAPVEQGRPADVLREPTPIAKRS